jgi:hypothetical protein
MDCAVGITIWRPIKSREDIYPLIRRIDFSQVLDASKGILGQEEFERWHEGAVNTAISLHPKLNDQYGWAAKIINVYLKTYAYIGDGGREDIRSHLHPPIDKGLRDGISSRFAGRNDILKETHCVKHISDIKDRQIYLKIISGLRKAAKELQCPLIEVEQLWEGTRTA